MFRYIEELACNPPASHGGLLAVILFFCCSLPTVLGCCMVLSPPRHSWRSTDTSVSRAPKLQPPLSSGMPSGMMEGCEGKIHSSNYVRPLPIPLYSFLSIPPRREFQWVSQLPISGVLDQATLRQMTLPRCGVADTDSHAAWAKRISALFAGPGAKMRRKKRFARPGKCIESN